MEPSILEEVEVEREATVRRVPTRILGMEVKKLRNHEVKLVKVQWRYAEEDTTWETEAKIRAAYPFLFEGTSLISFFLKFIQACIYLFSVSPRSYFLSLGRDQWM